MLAHRRGGYWGCAYVEGEAGGAAALVDAADLVAIAGDGGGDEAVGVGSVEMGAGWRRGVQERSDIGY